MRVNGVRNGFQAACRCISNTRLLFEPPKGDSSSLAFLEAEVGDLGVHFPALCPLLAPPDAVEWSSLKWWSFPLENCPLVCLRPILYLFALTAFILRRLNIFFQLLWMIWAAKCGSMSSALALAAPNKILVLTTNLATSIASRG